ncbi:MAG: endonuclease/exonuclease/phosphatase family protein [Deltaproteobacteria bacterium]|nr:endonuclease/exonuclease/phosphatase family protein [Deltaproteobacteria bacterium]
MWRCEAWWVRALDFPRLQLFVISLILLLMEAVLLDLSHFTTWGLFIVALLCLIYHAWWQARLDTLEPDYPYAIKCPLDNLYGMHVYSRLQLTDRKIEYLVEPDIPSIHTLVSLPTGDKIRVHFLHPSPPSPTENEESSERDAELIIVAKSIAETDVPVIVTGDLNDVAWSETTRLFRKISGLLDPRVGRGMFNTFHADYWFMRWPLDHLFHSRHFTLSRISRLRSFGSDHFALFTELVFEAGCNDKRSGLEADEEDLSWAKAKADDQGVNKNDVPQPGTPRTVIDAV